MVTFHGTPGFPKSNSFMNARVVQSDDCMSDGKKMAEVCVCVCVKCSCCSAYGVIQSGHVSRLSFARGAACDTTDSGAAEVGVSRTRRTGTDGQTDRQTALRHPTPHPVCNMNDK